MNHIMHYDSCGIVETVDHKYTPWGKGTHVCKQMIVILEHLIKVKNSN